MDFLADPTFRVIAVPLFAALGHALMRNWWERFKEREASGPMPMKLRNGVYVPHSRVRIIQRWIDRLFVAWLVYIAVLLAMLAWVKLA